MYEMQKAIKMAARCPETVSRLIWKSACPSSLKTWVIDSIIHVNVEEGYWTEKTGTESGPGGPWSSQCHLVSRYILENLTDTYPHVQEKAIFQR